MRDERGIYIQKAAKVNKNACFGEIFVESVAIEAYPANGRIEDVVGH